MALASTVVAPSVHRRDVAILGHLGGKVWDVTVAGDHLYASTSSGLEVFALSPTGTPSMVGDLIVSTGNNHEGGIVVVDDRAYLLGTFGLYVIDVSVPETPRPLGGIAVAGWGLAVSSGFAYVVGPTGLTVVDVHDAAALREVTRLYDGQNLLDVAAANGFLFVASGDLRILDLADPAAPHEVRRVNRDAKGVALAGNRAYLVEDSAVSVIDVTNPPAAQLLGFTPTPAAPCGGYAFACGVTVGNGLVFSSGAGGVNVIDATDPASPMVLGSLATSIYAYERNITASGQHAYAAAGDGGLRVVDVSTPATPVETAALGPAYILDLSVENNLAWIADGSNGFRVVDVSMPESPRAIGVVAASFAEGVALAGGLEYLVDQAQLRVFDAPPPVPPSLSGSIALYGLDAAVASGRAFVRVPGMYGNASVDIIDVTDPSAPRVVGNLPGQHSAVAAEGSLLYSVNYGIGKIYDVSTPAVPVELASVGGPAAFDVAVESGRLAVSSSPYATDGTTTVYDVTVDPRDPRQVATFDGVSGHVAVAGGRVFAAGTVVDPQTQSVIASLEFPDSQFAVIPAPTDDLLYLGTSSWGCSSCA